MEMMTSGHLKLLQKSYAGKKVFVTGHTGFKGSWLTIWLEKLGANVTGYALKPITNPSLYQSIENKLNCQSIIADIRDKEKLKREILSFQPDYIFHLAAYPLVLESYNQPVETFEVNAIGTANVLEAVRHLTSPCSVVIITTDKVYHNQEWHYPYRENEMLGGYDPYSASKAAAEIVTASFRSSYFNPQDYGKHKKGIATARAGNVIGGGDYSKNRIVPDIFRALKAGKPVPVRNPSAVRPWQHVLEPLLGYLLLGAKLKNSPRQFSTAFNFGPHPEDTWPVMQLVRLAIREWGSGSFEIPKQKKALHEARLLKLDINKAANELEWKPRWSAQTAIHHTIDWYKQSLAKRADVYRLCLNNIESYEHE
jgi:CDP-glucose 4,6-dehydratase